MNTHTHTGILCIYLPAFINDDMQTGFCIDINLCNLLPMVSTLPVSHEDEGGDEVEGGHAEVRDGQVHKEVVGHAPHPPVG